MGGFSSKLLDEVAIYREFAVARKMASPRHSADFPCDKWEVQQFRHINVADTIAVCEHEVLTLDVWCDSLYPGAGHRFAACICERDGPIFVHARLSMKGRFEWFVEMQSKSTFIIR